MTEQNHHLASDKNSYWTGRFKEITDPLGLNLTKDAWNLLRIPHGSSHTVEYHQWVYDNIDKAEMQAKGDPVVFTALFEAWVKAVVKNDPTITRTSYWDCYR
jgi:A nuclease family of the HNH/ENDO VII superfamily with conserved AHH